jgi:N-acetylneuraminic acid mutarotase
VCALLIPAASSAVTLTIHVSGPSGRVFVSGLPGGEIATCDVAQVTCTFDVVYPYYFYSELRLAAAVPAGQTPGHFINGTGQAAGCSLSTCNVTMTADAEVTASFAPAGPIVTLTTTLSGDGGGTVTADHLTCQNVDPGQSSTCAVAYVQGSQVSLFGIAAAGSRMANYAGKSTFPISSDTTLTVPVHALTSITVSPPSVSIPALAAQMFTAYGTYSNGVTEILSPFTDHPGTWTTNAATLTPRSSFAAASVSGKLYAIGGLVAAGSSTPAPANAVEAYDPAGNAWTAVAPMASPRAALAAVNAGGFLYAIGGDDGSAALSSVERYDPAANTWAAVAPMPTPRMRLAAGAVDGIVYAVGGEAGGTTLGTLEAYDPSTNTWSTKASMPTPRRGLGVAVVAGTLYAVGGSDAAGNPLATLEAYNPGTNTWTTKTPSPFAGTGLTVVAVEDTMYAVTAVETPSNLPATYVYHEEADYWSVRSNLPSPRGDAAAAALGARIYVIGGRFASANVNTVQSFTDWVRFSVSNTRVATMAGFAHAAGIMAGTTSIVVSAGDVVCGSCATLTVTDTAPTVITGTATNVTEHSATLSGFVNPNGEETSAYFTYHRAVANLLVSNSTESVGIGNGLSYVPVSVSVTGLLCNTSYSFWIEADNLSRTNRGRLAAFRTTFTTAACPRARRGDFDGDGRADLAVTRNYFNSRRWYVQGAALNSFGFWSDVAVPADYYGTGTIQPAVFRRPSTWYLTNETAVTFGLEGDIPVPADYDGNHTDDIAMFRPSEGGWYVLGQFTRQWGLPGDIPVPADYDADGKADLAVFRPSTGVWWIAYSSTNFATNDGVQWGLPGDIPVTGDFDGDGRADLAVFRPVWGMWYIAMSHDSYATRRAIQYGLPADIPLARDLDGDGVDEIVVYRPDSGMWFWYVLGTDTAASQQWGLLGDQPVGLPPRQTPRAFMDVDGDGRSELVVYRSVNGTWYTQYSSTGAANAFTCGVSGLVPVATNAYSGISMDLFDPATGRWYRSACFQILWGTPGDVPVPADYTGDGRPESAVFRPSTGEWFVANPQSAPPATLLYALWGSSGDTPMPADYDGDGRADFAVWRPSTGEWFVRFSSGWFGGALARQWGESGDIPIAADFDGDGRADMAVWRPSTGAWWVMNPFTGAGQPPVQWGVTGDRPVVKDFDGDGRVDLVVWRPSTGQWWIKLSSTGAVLVRQWGLNGDVPF